MFSQRVLRSSAPFIGTAIIAGGLYAVALQTSGPSESHPGTITDRAVQGSSKNPSNPNKIFTSGFSFQNLKLESSEIVNHNTKRLRFQLPDKDAVSGLHPSCTFRRCHSVHDGTNCAQLHSLPKPPHLVPGYLSCGHTPLSVTRTSLVTSIFS